MVDVRVFLTGLEPLSSTRFTREDTRPAFATIDLGALTLFVQSIDGPPVARALANELNAAADWIEAQCAPSPEPAPAEEPLIF
jgi:hypothetical protein